MTGSLAGQAIIEVEVYLNDVPSAGTYILQIYGSGAAPVTVLYSQDVIGSLVADSWNTLTLDVPYILDGTDIYVGFEINHIAGEYVLGIDAGPANPEGDWASFDGGSTWDHIGNYGFGNWNIRAVVDIIADPSAPAAPTGFTAVADAGGALTVDLDWTNPALDVAGNTLTELTSVDVYLDGGTTPIYTNASPTIGGTDSYTATVATGGNHTFKVVGTNSNGAGLPANVTVFVGVDVEVSAVILPEFALVNEDVVPEVTVMNNGVGTHSFDVSLSDGDAYNETVSVTNLASGNSTTLTFPTWSTSDAGIVTFTATATDPGSDVNLENNELSADLPVFGGCEHTLLLFDDYGDGWNGNTATVTVNGAVALDNVTLAAGTGPETFSFFAETGDDIQFDFWANGSWIDECFWEMYDGEGTLLFEGGLGTVAVTEYATGQCPFMGHNVTFNVDMTDSIASGYFVEGTDELWVGGSMNGWTMPGDDAAYEMAESATPDIYTLTLQLEDGDYMYKYFKIVGGVSSWDNGEWNGDPNRAFSVAGADVTLNDLFGNQWNAVSDLSKGISIYPNPSNGMFNINVTNSMNLEVFDITGKLINAQVLNGISNLQINHAGVYFLKFSNEEGSTVQRVVVK
jgi:hypothetical protein